MKSAWEYAKWIGAALLLVATAVAAFIYGKQENIPALKNARVREKRAKLRRVQLEYDTAKADADKAASDTEAAEHMERANTTQLKIVKLQTELTGDWTDAAKKLSDQDLADADNLRRVASHDRADSVG
jgi:hypothetical protein